MHTQPKLVASILQLIFAIGAAAGCGKANDDNRGADAGGYFELQGLAGTWQTECAAEDGASEIRQIKATGNQLWYRRLTFQSNDCNSDALKTIFRRHAVGAQGVAADLDGWQSFEWMVNSSTLSVHQNWLLERFNTRKYYDLDNWTLGEPREISGRKYTPESQPTLAIGDVRIYTATIEADLLLLASYTSDGKTALRSDSPAFRYKKAGSFEF